MNYRRMVMRTIEKRLQDPEKLRLLNSALGLAGEAGEFADRVKKVVFHGNPMIEELPALLKELGDIRWYMELACDVLGVTIQDVERLNIEKLMKRYPNCFSEEAAQKRADTQDGSRASLP